MPPDRAAAPQSPRDLHAATAEERQPAPALAPGRLAIHQDGLTAALAVETSRPLDQAQPGIRRALVVIHGMLRNADVYQASGEAAAALADRAGGPILVVTPQFLAVEDVLHHGGGPDLLHWSHSGWKGGEAALGPAPVSSFAALDALLAHLADPALLPDLADIVVAGHSAGGQILQRYVAVGNGRDATAARRLRFVVANPSSYLYFSAERPLADGTFGAVDSDHCPDFDRWRYGLGDRPPYAARLSAAEIERRYLAQDVTYLLGSLDNDPAHPSLDRSGAAELQGPSRFERGQAYVRYLRARHPDLRHRLQVVDGVGHDGRGMLTSPVGLAALFSP